MQALSAEDQQTLIEIFTRALAAAPAPERVST
jgi:hypothetical protein